MGKNKKTQQKQKTVLEAKKQQMPNRKSEPIQTASKNSNQQEQSVVATKIVPSDEDRPLNQQPPNPMKFIISTARPYQVFNYTFGSKKVFFEFMCFTLLIVFVPIIIVYFTFNNVKDDPSYSEIAKIAISVGPSLLLINIFVGVYVYKAIKDPENYTKDEPLKHVIPVGFKEQSMDRKRFINKPIQQKNPIQEQKTSKNSPVQTKNQSKTQLTQTQPLSQQKIKVPQENMQKKESNQEKKPKNKKKKSQ